MYLKLYFIALISLFVAAPTQALQTPVQTYTSEDGAFTFQFPQSWFAEVVNPEYEQNASIVVYNLPRGERFENPDEIMMQISLPKRSYEVAVPGMGSSPVTPREAVAQLVQLSSSFNTTIEIAIPAPSGTPQPLVVQTSSPNVQELLVDGRSGAYGYVVIQLQGVNNLDASQLVFVIDLGNDYWVSGIVTSFSGGLTAIQNSEAVVLDIMRTMRYTPLPAINSGNASLPNVFSGEIGVWRRGSLDFFYPTDWYVATGLQVVLSNTPTSSMGNLQPQPGQVIVFFQGVDETRAAVEPGALGNVCGESPSQWTARTLVSEILGAITPARLNQLQEAGTAITQPEVVTANGVEIVYFRIYQGDYEIINMFVDLGDGQIPQMIATAQRGELGVFEAQLFEIAGTFRYTPTACPE